MSENQEPEVKKEGEIAETEDQPNGPEKVQLTKVD